MIPLLRSLSAVNYRNLKLDESDGITFDSLTIFVGANGSGKSNFMKLLRFLRDAMTGVPEDKQRRIKAFEDAIAKLGKGRVVNANLVYPASVGIGIFFEVQEGYKYLFRLLLLAFSEDSIQVSGELLQRSLLDPSSMPDIVYYDANGSANGNFTETIVSDGELFQRPIPSRTSNQLRFQLIQPHWSSFDPDNAGPFNETDPFAAATDPKVIDVSQGLTKLVGFVSGWEFYESSEVSISRIRGEKLELGGRDLRLSPDGTNLALVLYNLGRDNIDFRERLRQAMTELFPRTRDLSILPLGRTALSVEWHVQDAPRPYYLDEMSDGTLRMLCWAAILLSPKPAKLIVLDEPEVGVHPAWLRVLAGWIREAARRTQVIVSTHSPDLLDYFTADIDRVRVFRPTAEDSQLYEVVPLRRKALQPKFDEGWQLGDLYRVGDPNVGGWPW